MPFASLRCRSARFDDGRLNRKVKVGTLKIRVYGSKTVSARNFQRDLNFGEIIWRREPNKCSSRILCGRRRNPNVAGNKSNEAIVGRGAALKAGAEVPFPSLQVIKINICNYTTLPLVSSAASRANNYRQFSLSR